MHSQNLGAYLDHSDGIESLMPQAARLLQLRRHLTAALPEQLARSCEIANYKQGIVVIFAENGAIAAKLGHFRPKLIAYFSERGFEITAIETVVQVKIPQRLTGPNRAAQLSQAGLASLAGLAGSLPNSPLKQAVEQLVNRHKPPR